MDSATPEKLKQFSPPGGLSDLTPDNQAIWSDEYISGWMEDEIHGKHRGPDGKPRSKLTQFFNGTVTAYDISTEPKYITWNAFPRRVTLKYGANNETRWKVADSSRDFQDEYLEWSVARDGNANVISVSYTCEGPEYWEFFASVQRKDALAEIMRVNGSLIEGAADSDFFKPDPNDPNNKDRWIYDPNNRWNRTTTTGTICHLAHPANTLGAEIDIAAQATVIRKDSSGKTVTDSDKLIRCSKYGDPGRNSDPKIGASINELARRGLTVTLADPVALYMNEFTRSNFKLDVNGDKSQLDEVPDSWFETQRGDLSKRQGLRLRVYNATGLKKKDGSYYNVSDIYDTATKTHIKYGAQFADYIAMGVAGVAGKKLSKPADPLACPGSQPVHSIVSAASASLMAFEDVKEEIPAKSYPRRGAPVSRYQPGFTD